MVDDPQNVGPLMASLGARRVGVDHWTEHDFEMERIKRRQDADTYRERLDVLEAHGWTHFDGPYYYGGREWHGGHRHVDRGNRRVPTKVAFAMLLEDHPEIELPPYRPHPHGWTPPRRPPGEGLIQQELVSVEPMKVPNFGLLALLNSEHGTEEERRERRERRARMEATFRRPGVRAFGDVLGPNAEKWLFVTLESEDARDAVPETWEGLPVVVKVKPEAEERAEKEAAERRERERYEEERAWLKKGGAL